MKYWEYGIVIFNFYSGVFFRFFFMLENNFIFCESYLFFLVDLEI